MVPHPEHFAEGIDPDVCVPPVVHRDVKIIPEFCSSILQNGHFILEVFLNQELTDEILSFGKCSSENFRCKSSE